VRLISASVAELAMQTIVISNSCFISVLLLRLKDTAGSELPCSA
jgi:hypothetical protein